MAYFGQILLGLIILYYIIHKVSVINMEKLKQIILRNTVSIFYIAMQVNQNI